MSTAYDVSSADSYRDVTHIIVIFQILQILAFILTQGLGYIGVLDDIQYSLRLLLKPFIC
jgi:hypothetical protein